MNAISALIRRNCKLFFKDKGMFFSSLITPMILLVLYVTFLAKTFRNSFASGMEGMPPLSDQLLDGLVAAQLASSLLAVCCVTVAFCSNLLMVQDKVTGARRDLTVSPVRRSALSISYYLATVFSTLIICLTALAICLGYMAKVGWYLSGTDVGLMVRDVVLLVLFGTALSSVIHVFLSTQGQISAVGTIVSAGYGFLCGAYMPISQFGEGLQKILHFFPGTYGTVLIRTHTMGGCFRAMAAEGVPAQAIKAMKDMVDCNLYFSGTQVTVPALYLVLGSTIAVLLAVYVCINVVKKH